MNTKNPETEFDRLIHAHMRDAAKQKYNRNSARNLNFHRDNYRPDPAPLGRNRSVNFANFFARAGAQNSHELADAKFTVDPLPPAPSKKQVESLGDKRWKYQGKTYKEEPLGEKTNKTTP